MENCICSNCSTPFELHDRELYFQQLAFPGLAVPRPEQCSACRRRTRMAWRNERRLYRRNCDLCQRSIISMYAPNAPCLVYCQRCFWSDQWNVLKSGREFDFSRPFFEQFAELLSTAPLIALINVKTENSEYCHRIYDGRNNYLSFIALYGPENLLHTYFTQSCKDSVDISFCQKVEHCYEVVEAENCYQCYYCTRVIDCSESLFLEDCIGCANCFGCKNLRHQRYCIYNKQHAREEYHAFLQQAGLDRYATVQKLRTDTHKFFQKLPSRAVNERNSESSSGANLFHCKDCKNCFDLYECEDLLHSVLGEKSHNIIDCYGFGESNHCYESVTIQNGQNIFFSSTAIDCSDLRYCCECYANSRNCFGCVGLKRGECCILNKAYSKAEYEKLLKRVLQHLNETGELGRFLPMHIAPFAFNESDAQLEFPLSEEQIRQGGLRWRDKSKGPSAGERLLDAATLPDSILEAGDEIASAAISCTSTGIPFRIVRQELDFYRRHRIPLPRLHPEERYRRRISLRNPRQLWPRQCAHCQKNIQSSYALHRPEVVYCTECYRAEVY